MTTTQTNEEDGWEEDDEHDEDDSDDDEDGEVEKIVGCLLESNATNFPRIQLVP